MCHVSGQVLRVQQCLKLPTTGILLGEATRVLSIPAGSCCTSQGCRTLTTLYLGQCAAIRDEGTSHLGKGQACFHLPLRTVSLLSLMFISCDITHSMYMILG